ncbi:putative F-box domain-containing protein [Helianthus annuus]|uniref:F-box domain-containing protein n=1 Tax=Helianthus annuus TaxID=4232 RepID=A0A251UZG5_HELAN|nr:F-box protein GID2 [Helianthus annuus]KAF5808964.1 putative F-box domain-containing protein [Helianthus annuus]KAJ0580040.1 putative F-box domain-containing protein [Helianthus annuus]KAJ0595953.1 putative F-box domain-containing protein [Helianthus annuus]KAJ0756595.1 putative F-box domain-containing protein [Helianthus annuus]KAJ0760346.1 putative F-box domain-containing protein [Helianthus annuus]
MVLKRSIPVGFGDPKTTKKMIIQSEHDQPVLPSSSSSSAATAVFMDAHLLYEVLKHVDARTLGAVACVSKHWHRTAQDERLWELICTRQWANIRCASASDQLRSVVLAFGSFQCLHSHYLLPLSKLKEFIEVKQRK